MVTRYWLRWGDSRTARIRREDAGDHRPLAWLRLLYASSSHEVSRVDVHTHAGQLPGRLWRGSVESVDVAVTFCQAHELELAAAAAGEDLPDGVARPPVHPWALSTVVDGT
jgi:hypothetical protein